VASSNVSEVQDCRKRSRQQQIQGSSWVLRGQITIDQLHANSDGMTAVPEGDVENEDRISKLNARLQGLWGAQFKILFGKLSGNVKYFVVFCNFTHIPDVGSDLNDEGTAKIEILSCFVDARSILAEFSVIVLQDSNSKFGVPNSARGLDSARA